MDNPLKYRYELKYPCDEVQLAVIKVRLSQFMALDPHAQNGSYTIRSMYFDNYQNSCFYENENGTDPREKFRIRIYNADSSRISLECKRKEHGKTYKTACTLSHEQYHQLLSNGKGIELSTAPDLLRKFWILMNTQGFRPSVIVEYDRMPYVYELGNVRITLDCNIRSSNDFEHFLDKTLITRPILPRGRHLVEVKYDELLPDFIKSSLELGELRRTSFSKFYLCRKYITGGKL